MATKVMLSVRQCQYLLKTLSFRQNTAKLGQFNGTSRCSPLWKFYSTPAQDDMTQQALIEEDEDLDRQREIDAKRDVSRLPNHMRARLEHRLEVPEINPYDRNPTRVKRKVYSYYGKASGIDPTVAWPTEEELQEELEFEQEFEPTLQERWATLRAKQEAEIAERKEKEAHVLKQMAKMPEYIAQYRKKLAKVEEAEQKQEAKRNAMMEEARDYFGFHIDPRDPRFKQMQEDKAEAELKLKKLRKKEEKGLRVAASMKRLQMEAEEAKQKASES